MGRNVVRASNLWNVAKYMSRGNEGVDSLFGSVSANMTKYVMLKDYYKDQGMSRNAAGAAAYTDLYVTEEKFNDAMEQARGEIANMGISPSENMVKRRAYEIIDENREIPQDRWISSLSPNILILKSQERWQSLESMASIR